MEMADKLPALPWLPCSLRVLDSRVIKAQTLIDGGGLLILPLDEAPETAPHSPERAAKGYGGIFRGGGGGAGSRPGARAVDGRTSFCSRARWPGGAAPRGGTDASVLLQRLRDLLIVGSEVAGVGVGFRVSFRTGRAPRSRYHVLASDRLCCVHSVSVFPVNTHGKLKTPGTFPFSQPQDV
ncbi:hypothetical protein AAFF_G00322000 [Aldrovandia affinis]|uniref:Uncharacterized protein n=1 Tax=Aldrovandia affinis TaxID=143900 RepID=A0AAD7WR17_9TELE|nr:hypothetical protein AAFF_G00322000 [Aldrovandia affinis]